MIGSDYVLEAHNIFHTTEVGSLQTREKPSPIKSSLFSFGSDNRWMVVAVSMEPATRPWCSKASILPCTAARLWPFWDRKVLLNITCTLKSNNTWIRFSGSGKRALLDVISRRADGATRGQVLLNGSPLSKALFQQRCGYVTQSCTFVPGLTVAQTLHYTPTIVSIYFKYVINVG